MARIDSNDFVSTSDEPAPACAHNGSFWLLLRTNGYKKDRNPYSAICGCLAGEGNSPAITLRDGYCLALDGHERSDRGGRPNPGH